MMNNILKSFGKIIIKHIFFELKKNTNNFQQVTISCQAIGIFNDIGKSLKIPEWILDTFPNDLKKVFHRALPPSRYEPSASGRKSAIDEDNISDLAYYLLVKKGIFQGFNINSSWLYKRT